jgi:hypothetical protein
VSQRKVSKKVFYTSIALCIILLATLSVIVYGIIQESGKQKENQQNQQATPAPGTPELVTVDLKCNVESGKLHVSGYVKNVGDAKANNCTLYVNSVINGSQAGPELSAPLEPLEAGEQRPVDLEFPFSASGLAAFNTYLKWTN